VYEATEGGMIVGDGLRVTPLQAAEVMLAFGRSSTSRILPEVFRGGLGFRVQFGNGFTLDYSLPASADAVDDSTAYEWSLMAGEKVEGLR
jgi:hypothetical protein